MSRPESPTARRNRTDRSDHGVEASVKSSEFSLTSVPAFWPMAMAASLMEQGAELYAKNLKFVEEEIKIHDELRPDAGDAEHGAARSAHHGVARLRQAGRDPDAGRRAAMPATPR